MKHNLKQILEDRNISILELSKMTGIHYRIVYLLVNREDLSETRLKSLYKISKALDITIDDILKEE